MRKESSVLSLHGDVVLQRNVTDLDVIECPDAWSETSEGVKKTVLFELSYLFLFGLNFTSFKM